MMPDRWWLLNPIEKNDQQSAAENIDRKLLFLAFNTVIGAGCFGVSLMNGTKFS